MLPFSLHFKPGLPVYEQVVYSVKKAIISGSLKPGDRFPSVRTLSQESRINPNTAHKVVATLVNEHLLEVRPGIGTLVAEARSATREQRYDLLGPEVERIMVEAMRLHLDLEDILKAVKQHWKRLSEQSDFHPKEWKI